MIIRAALTFFLSAVCFADVPLVRLIGPLNPGSAAHLKRGIDAAAVRGAPYVVLRLDTDGGLLPATREIVQKILDSSVPVVAYVGVRAGSLGALLLEASDVAVMAPNALLGGDPPGVTDEYRAARTRFESELGELADHVARARARNSHGASKAVHAKEPVTAEAALRDGLLDFTAESDSDLAAKLVGWKLRVPKGGALELPAEKAELAEYSISPWHAFLSFVCDTRLAYGLLFLGAVLFALSLARSGALFPAVLGGFCFAASLGLFYFLPISYGALALLLAGLGFVVMEGWFPTYGLFGISGLAAFIFGSLWLVDTTAPDFQLPLGWVLACSAITAAIGFALSYGVFRGRRRKRKSGLEALVGEFGETKAPVTSSKGKVFVQGELWAAVTDAAEEIAEGAIVVVTGVRGISLVVKAR